MDNRLRMEIPDRLTPMLVVAIRDAVERQTKKLDTENLEHMEDAEEYLVQLDLFFNYVRKEYKQIEEEVGVSLEDLLKLP